ncbi:hypothetical protein JKF63_05925 [Porcisia hertigi]|uniref:Uncharacterized protein n=1 Tax=Porcisia hertigi TaxID=2761500 RepID=A0A836LDG8_9TRYP|nr:hypothetical protein JKF63_05925 [Porcisia hertigi]
MPGAPDKILVGPTTYVCLRHKQREYYVPDFINRCDADSPSLLPAEHREHLWRYSVSKEHSNTVFFYNLSTRKSVWVLPIVHRDGRTEALGEGETMRPIYSSSVDDVGVVETPERRRGELSNTGGHDEEKKGKVICERPGADVAGSSSSSLLMRSAAPHQPFSAENGDPRHTPPPTRASLAAKPSLDSPAALPTATRERVHGAVERASEAEAPCNTASLGTMAEGESRRPTLQNRLAAWRARQRGAVSQLGMQQEKTSTAENSTVFTAAKAEIVPQVVEDFSPHAMSPTAPLDFECGSSTVARAEHTGKSTVLPQTLGTLQGDLHVHTPAPEAASPSFAAEAVLHTPVSEPAQSLETPAVTSPAVVGSPTVRERELSKVTARLHREKIAAMQQEIATLECRRRALSVEQAEAENRVRLAQARTAAERARLQEMEQAAHEQAQRRAALAASAAPESCVQDVKEYIEKQRQLQDAAQSTVTDSFADASHIAARLAPAVPRPENLHTSTGGTSREVDCDAGARLTPPHYRAHQVGQVEPTVGGPSAASPGAAVHDHRAAEKNVGGGLSVRAARTTLRVRPASASASAALRRQTHLTYAVPHLCEGRVITYRPSSGFTRQGALNDGTPARGNESSLAHKSLSEPTAPLVLTAKRDGAGTQYKDPAHKHFFRGTWCQDRRDGAGVLSPPTTAVQGGWRDDQLVGPAVVQTRRSKGAVTFVSGQSASGTHALDSGPGEAFSREGGADPSIASYTSGAASGTTRVTGNAVVELDNKALFVGALEEGRVRAPYVLQLGQGDYIEWLGAPASAGRSGGSPSRTSGEVLRHTPAHAASSASASKAGTGECRIRFRNEDTYVGHVSNFQLHGFGHYRFAEDGHSYTGHFKKGWPHGKGLLVFANGDVYRGSFVDGLFDGHGTYLSKVGHYVYEGDWVAGTMNGEGSLAFANGDVWRGTLHNNKRVAGGYTTLA